MRKSIWKRALSLVLSLAMLLTLVPAFDVLPEAEAAEGPQGNYITLPITIRDFAADGMLFEYNEVDTSDTITIGSAAAVGYPVYENPDDWAVNNYYNFRLYDYGEIAFDTANDGLNWHCVICDGSGNVVDVLAVGEEKETTYDNVMQSGYFSIWVWQDDHENYAALSKVTDDNKSIYAIDFHLDSDTDAYKMYIGYRYNENAWGDNWTGINYFAAGQDPFADNYDARWTVCLICDASGNVIQAIGSGQDKQTAFNAMSSGQFALFAHSNDPVALGIIQAIAGDNPTEYQATFVTDNYYKTDLLFLGNGSQSMTLHQADTKGFGLMLTGANDRIQNLTTTSGPGTYVGNGTYGSSTSPADKEITLNSTAKQILHGATIRYDLVVEELVNGKPAYTEATVTYLANYMNQIMNEPWQNTDGSYNSFFVMGTKLFDASGNYVGPNDPAAKLDLAAMLRQFVGDGGLGDYDTTMAKAATLTDVSKCKTWFDAAYYLLHYTWQDSPSETNNGRSIDGYGMPVPQYESLHLLEKTNADGSVYYVFNSGYDGTAYDPSAREIYNTQTETVTAAQDSSGDFYTRGIKLPAARFDPLGLSGTGSTGTAQWLGYGPNAGGNTYGDLTGASATQLWAEYYDTTNYHLSLEGHAEFVFHYDSNLYFTFTGDDDVYLYINGIRVLDLGAAHSIVEATININDVAELCGLKEGEPARFDFFYLERHGTAANFGIETNIQLAESGMITSKQGYQNGLSTGYNGYVDPTKPVAYSFTLKNAGDATLEHLTFADAKLGVSLSEYDLDWGNKIEGTDANDNLVDGGPIKNMYLYIRDENDAIARFYSSVTTPALTETVLKEELKNGLPKGYSMTIYNFRYTISDTDWEDGKDTFTNVVNTTAIANNKQVHGTADWKVQKMQAPYTPFHVYDWVHKDAKDTEWETPTTGTVTLTKAELMQYLLGVEGAETQEQVDALVANEDVYIVRCTASGHEEDYLQNPCVKVNADNSITYTSAQPGMDTVFYEIKETGLMGSKLDDLAFSFDVFTYGTMDNVYVLDYGLKVKLNEEDFGFRVNDKLTVPENIHKPTTTITALKDNTCVYGDFMIEDAEGVYKSMSEFNAGTNDGEKSVEYWPKNIMNNTDSFKVEIQVREPGEHDGKDLKFYGVDMYETVTTAPANVVYYEDDFPGLVYVHNLDNGWVQYETVDEEGNPIIDEYQSADQNSNYGSDPNYEVEEGGTMMEVTEPTEGEDDTTITPDGTPDETQNLLLDTGKLSTLQKAALKAMKQFLGVGGADSNGGVHGLQVNKTDEVMWFEFVGTGFEIISRTTDEQYAVIMVQVQKPVRDASGNLVYLTDDEGNIVYKKDASGNLVYQTDEYGNVIKDDNGERIKIPELKYEVYKHKPVITESAGGDLYQVPIISFTNLDRLENGDKYRVVITAAGEYIGDVEDETDNVKRLLYIDGIRIYNPLLPGQALEYYNPQEAQAKFMEIKQLVKDGEAAYFGLETPEDDDDKFFLVSGISYAENFSGEGTLTEIDNIGEYMDNGPNNELYLNADGRFGNMVAFYLTPKEDVDESARTIQIGAHRKLGEETNVSGAVFMTYGSTRADIAYADKEDANYKKISTGTEMYYTIDVDLLDTDEQGRYLLMIGTNGSDDGETLVLTNLKVSGYKIEKMEDVLKEAYKSGKQEENAFIAELADMYLAVITQNRSMARLITEGNAVLFGYDEEKEEPYLYSRRSYITDLAGEGQRTIVDNQEDYLADAGRVGDFGELKLEVSENFVDMVAFYVKPNANIPESARYIQLGVQGLDFDGTAIVVYGNSSDDFDLETNSKKITGNEEEILDIVVDESWDDGTGHLVIITAGADENGLRQPFALTSLEVCGYTVEPVEMEIRDAVAAEGELSLPIITALLDVWNTLFPAEEAEETPDEEDTVTPASEEEAEELLTGEEAVTEETEPEEAETVAAEPEEAETEATEPEEAESDETEPEETVSEIAE